MYLVLKLAILIGLVVAAVGVTKNFRTERAVLAELGIEQQKQLQVIAFTWLCVWVPVAAVAPFTGPFLLNPLPLGALLTVPAIVMARKVNVVLERSGTDRSTRAKEATDHAFLIACASAVLAIVDWGFARLVGSLPSVTGGQL